MSTPIFVNGSKYEASRVSMTGRDILALAGFGPDHDVFLLQGEGDPTGGSLSVWIRRRGKPVSATRDPRNRNFGNDDDAREAL